MFEGTAKLSANTIEHALQRRSHAAPRCASGELSSLPHNGHATGESTTGFGITGIYDRTLTARTAARLSVRITHPYLLPSNSRCGVRRPGGRRCRIAFVRMTNGGTEDSLVFSSR